MCCQPTPSIWQLASDDQLDSTHYGMDEVALIKQAKRGDVVAFNRLVLEYQQVVYNVAYRIMGEPQAAEDATQDAFISAYQSLNRFRGGNFRAWLLRIVTNGCYDKLRRRKRRPQSSLDELTDANESFAFLRSPNEGPESHQQRMELLQAIERCLEELPDDQRITAVLCDIEGHNYKEISQITSVSLGTVKSRISRARTRLRDCLQGFAELLPSGYRLNAEGQRA
jgi:RNA polymerase sigma factor (sigma-70 family)